jgi:hypothetical protein
MFSSENESRRTTTFTGRAMCPAEIIKPALAKILRDYESRLPHEPTDGGVFIPQNLCLPA